MKTFYLLVLSALFFIVPATQGCTMHDHEALPARSDTHIDASAMAHVHEQGLISQLMLKPAPDVVLDADQRLTSVYLGQLQVDADGVRLSYVRPMSMGLHVLGLEPALARDAAVALAKLLTDRSDVEYAEPDFPRRRR